jgi:hypothetical protein
LEVMEIRLVKKYGQTSGDRTRMPALMPLM